MLAKKWTTLNPVQNVCGRDDGKDNHNTVIMKNSNLTVLFHFNVFFVGIKTGKPHRRRLTQ